MESVSHTDKAKPQPLTPHERERVEALQRRLANLKPPYQKGESGNPGGKSRYAEITRALRQRAETIDPATGLSGAQELAGAWPIAKGQRE